MKLPDPSSEIALHGLEVYKDEFIFSRQSDIFKIHEALLNENYIAIKKFCHVWRGFAVPYGFGELVRFANELEESSANQNKKLCKEILSEIQSYLSTK